MKVSGKTVHATGAALFIFLEFTSTTATGWTTRGMDKGSVCILMALCMTVIGNATRGKVPA